MVAGRLQEKRGYYYMILGFTDQNGKWVSKWMSTGLKIKGNKKKAEQMLSEARRNFDSDTESTNADKPAPQNIAPNAGNEKQDILFADFMLDWLKIMRNSIEATTLASYQLMIEKQIAPYFRDLGVRLVDLEAKNIQDYYQYMMDTRGVCANTVIHHHANIRKALQYAFKIGLILSNPADKIERPKKQKFVGSFYDGEELNRLFEISRGHKLELAIILGAFYGLRREEVVGLKWSAIDFQSKSITIKHTVTEVTVDGKTQIFEKDRTKNQSSRRTLPLVPQFETLLLKLKEKQEYYRGICKSSYNTKYLDYLCVDEMGNRIKPNWISEAFPRLLTQNNLRRIRYHDLRHSCASLLLANGVSMKEIQEWLGHGVHENTQLTKLLDLRRLNKFSRGAICKEFWNSFLMGRFARTSGQEFILMNMERHERLLYRRTMPLKKSSVTP